MDASVLVDSNVFIGLLQRRRDPVGVLGSWIGEGDLITCGMVRLEVERGLRTADLRQHLAGFFNVMRYGHTSNKVWENATQLAWTLDRQGRTLPAQDLLIAAIARSLDAAVLTDDAHFLAIPSVTVLRPGDCLAEWD